MKKHLNNFICGLLVSIVSMTAHAVASKDVRIIPSGLGWAFDTGTKLDLVTSALVGDRTRWGSLISSSESVTDVLENLKKTPGFSAQMVFMCSVKMSHLTRTEFFSLATFFEIKDCRIFSK